MNKVTKLVLFFSALMACAPSYAFENIPSLPVAAPATSSLRGTIEKESVPAGQDNSVGSFFQLGPSKNDTRQSPFMMPATTTSKATNKNKPVIYHIYRFFWHVLDNAGVPIFFGNNASDLDPSITRSYIIPSPKLPSERDVTKETDKANTTVIQSPVSPAGAQPEQKIPESELEGTIYESPATHNVRQPAQ